MNKKFSVWAVGGLLTAAVLAVGVSPAIAGAPEKSTQAWGTQANQPGVMPGKMNPQAMAEMMKTPAMQKQCLDMMKDPAMQQVMKDMMKTPELQGVMKQMLQQDMAFHQIMADLVNSVDMDSDHGAPQPAEQDGDSFPAGHSWHHG
ncbi:hypothetical protein [Sporomusa termitida]|uniref:Spore germination GerD central core domain-containing protein n=1 Tax=Sporomusa termitida TaxID=2377 RepID=A0A517DVZ1_9FIRM|nr:hypothetical protein [Sporomusa termitida]QDR81522.1 hypothetical protein SPTER_29080 [Sporomusa termitida]